MTMDADDRTGMNEQAAASLDAAIRQFTHDSERVISIAECDMQRDEHDGLLRAVAGVWATLWDCLNEPLYTAFPSLAPPDMQPFHHRSGLRLHWGKLQACPDQLGSCNRSRRVPGPSVSEARVVEKTRDEECRTTMPRPVALMLNEALDRFMESSMKSLEAARSTMSHTEFDGLCESMAKVLTSMWQELGQPLRDAFPSIQGRLNLSFRPDLQPRWANLPRGTASPDECNSARRDTPSKKPGE